MSRSGSGPAARLATALELLGRVPDSARRFTVSGPAAVRRYRLDPGLLAQLPTRGAGDGCRYDPYDLLNLALYLGTSADAQAVHRFWPAALNLDPASGRVEYELRYQVACPAGHDGDCRYAVAGPGGETILAAGADPPVTRRVSLPTRWPAPPAAVRAVLDTVADLVFVRLPRELAADPAFSPRSGLGDCLATSRLLAAEGRHRRVPVRTAFGLVVAPPFAIPHYWAEYRAADRWIPVDPVLLAAMLDWGILDPAQWHPYRSIGPVVVRFGAGRHPLARHNGDPIRVTIASRQVG